VPIERFEIVLLLLHLITHEPYLALPEGDRRVESCLPCVDMIARDERGERGLYSSKEKEKGGRRGKRGKVL
jgi:hypothetical protein